MEQKWDVSYKWFFSNLGVDSETNGDITGANIFEGTSPYYAVAREALQNIIDAKPQDEVDSCKPVVAKFEVVYISPEDFPGLSGLKKAINQGMKYINENGGNGETFEKVFKSSQQYLTGEKSIPALKISDYNTTGLEGMCFKNLVRSEGITLKHGDSNGSFGYGKFPTYSLSKLHTIIYSSQKRDGSYIFQAKAILSTFIAPEDGKRKKGISLFGMEKGDGDDCLPIENANSVPEIFRRSEPGTDIYILGFDEKQDWANLIAMSTLENFFMAINDNLLEVQIVNKEETIVINSKSLSELVDHYEKYFTEKYQGNNEKIAFTVPIYWKVFTEPDFHFPEKEEDKDFEGMGLVEFYCKLGHFGKRKKVLEMRSSGMRIREDSFSNFKLTDFCGVLIASGKGRDNEPPERNISKYLRSLETPRHDDWISSKRNENKEEAERILKKLKKLVTNSIREYLKKETSTSVDAFGVNQYLAAPSSSNGEVETTTDDAYDQFIPLPIKITVGEKIRSDKADLKKKINGRGQQKQNAPAKPKENGTPKSNVNNKQRGKIIAKHTTISNVKTPFIPAKDSYLISFIPEEDASELMIKIILGYQDKNPILAIPVSAQRNGNSLIIDGGYIIIPEVQKGEKIRLEVQLKDNSRYALKVTAYAKK